MKRSGLLVDNFKVVESPLAAPVSGGFYRRHLLAPSDITLRC